MFDEYGMEQLTPEQRERRNDEWRRRDAFGTVMNSRWVEGKTADEVLGLVEEAYEFLSGDEVL